MNDQATSRQLRPRFRRATVASAAVSAIAAASIVATAIPAQATVLGVQIVGSSTNPPGARVGDVVVGTPAEDAGLLPGDIITNLNNAPITTADDFLTAIGGVALGDWIAFSFSGATGAHRAAVLPLEALDSDANLESGR
jgi:S1-C subfamily serine protease